MHISPVILRASQSSNALYPAVTVIFLKTKENPKYLTHQYGGLLETFPYLYEEDSIQL